MNLDNKLMQDENEDLGLKFTYMQQRPERNTNLHPLLDITFFINPQSTERGWIKRGNGDGYEVEWEGYKPDKDSVIHGNPRLVEYGHTGEHKQMQRVEEGLTLQELGSRLYNDWDRAIRPGFYLVSNEPDQEALEQGVVSYKARYCMYRHNGYVIFSREGSNANPGGWKEESSVLLGKLGRLDQLKIYFSNENFR